MLVGETHYTVLSVEEDASYDEIRNSHRSALLQYHPDKVDSSLCSSDEKLLNAQKFLNIQKAWQVLSDAEQRLVYDKNLRASRQDGIAADEISIQDMSVEIITGQGQVFDFFYQCRCGDHFSVDSNELGTMGFALLRDGDCVQVKRLDAFVASVLLPCGSCSLNTRVYVDSDIKIPLQNDHL